ncbi:MAG: aminotransferase class I/II-fold pyridoxal phosphate-dependent enzyme [Flavobacteriales bacterium]|nr:aminotransferase class I/II-fold pyridoxal phosphate-dependent enzyme [Flavobacteriales bacterium]MBL6873759.1 aminotransferase class I/II-fold pyridoxal phosphate-dependent enzyme [Flavobacteriales bacterium]
MDLFEKIKNNRGPLGQYAKSTHGYFTFPKLEGEISNKMFFRGKEVLVWSVNNYIGLSNQPEVRKADEQASKEWGLGYPMGSRMMSGNTNYHEELENNLSAFMRKEDTILLNFGYQGMLSSIDALVDRKDVIVYDSECHACIIDGVRLHQGKRFVFPHNNIDNFEKQLERANKIVEETGGGILVITEGVFGMSGDLGKIREISQLKSKFNFRLFVDDAHGFGTMGEHGYGTGEHLQCHDEIDIYFGTFAKSMASIGAFISSTEDVVEYLRYNMRSQIFAKSLPTPLVIGAIKRLELLQNKTELKDQLWNIANKLQSGLKDAGFNIGNTESAVTPVYLSGGVGEATNLTLDLRENYGIFCSIVTYPVVPKGVILLRLIPTAIHTLEDVQYTIESFTSIKDKLENGEYISEKLASF